jgi:hypothetical protein
MARLLTTKDNTETRKQQLLPRAGCEPETLHTARRLMRVCVSVWLALCGVRAPPTTASQHNDFLACDTVQFGAQVLPKSWYLIYHNTWKYIWESHF